MNLRSVVQSLLPRDYREQVLGDLQELGFHIRDIASVVPQVWWSHLQRGWTLPRFGLAGASDAILQQRIEQFFRRSSWLLAAWIWLQGQSAVRLINGPLVVDLIVEAILLTIVLIARSVSLKRLEPLISADRPHWVEFHQRQLAMHRIWARLGVPYSLFSMTAYSIFKTFSFGDATRTQPIAWLFATFVVSLILGQFRASRLEREIKGLQ